MNDTNERFLHIIPSLLAIDCFLLLQYSSWVHFEFLIFRARVTR